MTVIPIEKGRDDKVACLVALQNVERTEAVWITTQGPTWQLLEIARAVAEEVDCDPPRATRALVDAIEASGRTIEGLGTKGEAKQKYPTVVLDTVTGEMWTDNTRPGVTADITNEAGERVSRLPNNWLRVTDDERDLIEANRAIRETIALINNGDPDADPRRREPEVYMRITERERDLVEANREIVRLQERLDKRVDADERRALTSDCSIIEDLTVEGARRPIGFIDH